MSDESLREEVLQAARRYYTSANPQKKFVAGETYIPVTAKSVGEDELSLLVDASLDMWLTAGRYSRQFESEFSSYFNRNAKSLLVNSGSSANLVAISSLGSSQLKKFGYEPLKKGDEVLTVAAGFPTTVNPIVQNGWIPVFVDVDASTLNTTLEKLQAAKTSKTRAVVLAHALGNPYRADQISAWCEKENMFLIEDCCDALGATINEQPVGSFGMFATSSFYPAHHITMGEGGAIIPKDAKVRKIAESIRDWGRDCWCEPGKDNTCGKRYCWQLGDLPEGYDHKYTYSHLGYNLKVTDMQAAIGIAQLKKLPAFIEERQRNWQKLASGVVLSPILRNKLRAITATECTTPSWFGFPVYCDDSVNRDLLVSELEKAKIGTRLFFAGNLTKQPAYKEVDYRIAGDLGATDAIMSKLFWLGVHPLLSDEMIEYTLTKLEELTQVC